VAAFGPGAAGAVQKLVPDVDLEKLGIMEGADCNPRDLWDFEPYRVTRCAEDGFVLSAPEAVIASLPDMEFGALCDVESQGGGGEKSQDDGGGWEPQHDDSSGRESQDDDGSGGVGSHGEDDVHADYDADTP
jgi:hypothetical protein